MEQMLGMMVEEVVALLEQMGEDFELEQYEDGEVFEVMVGDYYEDHVSLLVEDGQVVGLEYEEWE